MIETLTSLIDGNPVLQTGLLLITIATVVMISTGNLLPDFSKNDLRENREPESRTTSKMHVEPLYERVNRTILVGGWIVNFLGLAIILIGLVKETIK